MNSDNKINFLDMTIFIDDNSKLQFIKYRKDSVYTVIANFQKSVASHRYLKGSINTVLHREYTSCSTDELFIESLSELREVYARNSYPKALIESKIKNFMSQISKQTEKTPREPFTWTVCLEYTSPLIESNIYELSRKIKQLIPEFRLNIAFRAVKLRKLFSFHAKPTVEHFDKCNLIYEFPCTCEDSYIGETGRTLLVRIKEHHNTACSNICAHINTCEIYKKDVKNFVKENKQTFTNPQKARLSFFKDRFKIIGTGFKSDYDREKTEAYLIRTKMPKINDQYDHKLFQLFGAI